MKMHKYVKNRGNPLGIIPYVGKGGTVYRIRPRLRPEYGRFFKSTLFGLGRRIWDRIHTNVPTHLLTF